MSQIVKQVIQNLAKKKVGPSTGPTPPARPRAPSSNLQEFRPSSTVTDIAEMFHPGTTKRRSILQEQIEALRESTRTVSRLESASQGKKRKRRQDLQRVPGPYYRRRDEEEKRRTPFVPPSGRPGTPEAPTVPPGDDPELPPIIPPWNIPNEPPFDLPGDPPEKPPEDDPEDREEQFPSCEEIEKFLRALGNPSKICQTGGESVKIVGRL